MKVARQFTAWNAFIKKTRPLGHGLSCKLLGYHHLVLSGQNAFLRPVRKIDSTSA